MRNGYSLPEPAQLQRIEAALAELTYSDRDALIAQLRIGVQWNTEVTLPGAGHTETQQSVR